VENAGLVRFRAQYLQIMFPKKFYRGKIGAVF